MSIRERKLYSLMNKNDNTKTVHKLYSIAFGGETTIKDKSDEIFTPLHNTYLLSDMILSDFI